MDEPVTDLLRAAAEGREGAADALMPVVYDQLRRIAQVRMSGERAGHSLQATDLVHEAYLKMVGGVREAGWNDRLHFYRAAAGAMRRILIDHARHKDRAKRGGGATRVPLNVLDLAAEENSEEILALDEAICRLGEQHPRMGEIVRLRFFAGLGIDEIAASLDLSARTVKRDWTFARTWLYQQLSEADEREGQ